LQTLHDEIIQIGRQAKKASRQLALLSPERRIELLLAMADALLAGKAGILSANQKDLEAGKAAGLPSAMLERLMLSGARVDDMAKGLRDVAALPDPNGTVLFERTLPNGLLLKKVRVPIGVIAIVYESRPNVTAEAAALCVKSGNAVILRGGKEAFHSNQAIAHALSQGFAAAKGPEHAVQLIATTDRAAVKELVQLEGLVDLAIPRGGEGLIRMVSELARVPVIKHAKGVCHTYVDDEADLDMALAICENAKCQRPSVCNAMETLLVHHDVAQAFLPRLARQLGDKGVELRGDDASRRIVSSMTHANEDDWSAEYLDLILAVRVVSDVNEAIEHIAQYGSGHSDTIVTSNQAHADLFLQSVDSAAVYVNASTRFTDGSQFGMGAEMGISTDKIHARGPMGLEELVTYKWMGIGSGQVR
jgi:glutamate-5-semialdehyde dehydrogenase